jgi:hypothetical protein
LFDFFKNTTDFIVDVGYQGFIQVLFFTPVVLEGRDVDSDIFGDHPGGRAVIAVFSKQAAG